MENTKDLWGTVESTDRGSRRSNAHSGDALWDTESPKIRYLLNNKDADLEGKVKKTFKEWQQVARNAIKEEVGFRSLSRVVPIKVVDGFPKHLSDITKTIDKEILWILINRQVLEQTQEGLKILLGESHYISNLLKQDQEVNTNALQTSLDLSKSLFYELQKWEILKKLSEIEDDILGAYWRHVPEIHLYWMAISFVSYLLGVSVEALTFVVLTHELAHAYHHLGLDIDDKQWDTDLFSKTDRRIKEGLAQFHTEQVCIRMQGRNNEAMNAFLELRKHQSRPYVEYVEWIKDIKRPGEAVRATMLETRRRLITMYPDFYECFHRHKKKFM